MLKKTYLRDGEHRIIGSVTSGFTGGFNHVVRDEHEDVLGRTSDRFHTTRNAAGDLISGNTADAGLLFQRKK